MDLTNNKIKIYTRAIHVMVWLVLFLLPLWLMSGAAFEFNKVLEHFWLPLLYSIVIFYVNLFFLIDYFLFGKKLKILPFIGINLLMIGVFFGIHFCLKQAFFYHQPPKILDDDGKLKELPPLPLFIYKDLVSLTIPIIFSIALKASERLIRNERGKKEAEHNKLLAELRELKYRLQPHFFFNSLNNIYSLVDSKPEKAKETLHALSKLMRYMLYETEKDQVQLKQEIDFIRQYIDLMKIRLNDNVSLHVQLPAVPLQVGVSPLIFISLIENAFKHGISATQPSEIWISMHVENNLIQFHTRNILFPKNNTDMTGSGIGLDNLRKRLKIVYPNRHNFDATVQGAYFITVLSIEL